MAKTNKRSTGHRGGASPRPPSGGLIPGDRLHPALEAALRGEEPDEVVRADEAEEGQVARVVLARLSDLGPYVDARLRAHGDRPVWFLPEDDADDVELFQRYPEAPMPRATSDAILAALRAFVADKSDALQAVFGSTDSIELGFHTSAGLEDVAASFEDDGFELVIGAVTAGKVLGEEPGAVGE